jgi:HD-GYP domain-containing protein (c-di-GMP phosphodiesterase class II)
VQEHPVIGERILKGIIRNGDVLAAVRGHHERFDGSGYPDGLEGTQIPVLARLIAVVDCFDALTRSRSYREKLSVPSALEVIQAGTGSCFDPQIARAFLASPPTMG